MTETPISTGGSNQYKVDQKALAAFNELRAQKNKSPLTAEEMLARIGGDDPGIIIQEFSELYGQSPDKINEKAGPFTHRLLTTSLHTNGWIYIITLAGKLKFALDYDSASFREGAGHIDLAEGKNILAAGDIIIQDLDSIVWIDNGSGHYQPSGESPLKVTQTTFARKGWNDITPVWHDVTPNAPCPNPKCGRAVHSEWLDRKQKLGLALKLGVKVERAKS